jgi:hypothetical protein
LFFVDFVLLSKLNTHVLLVFRRKGSAEVFAKVSERLIVHFKALQAKQSLCLALGDLAQRCIENERVLAVRHSVDIVELDYVLCELLNVFGG